MTVYCGLKVRLRKLRVIRDDACRLSLVGEEMAVHIVTEIDAIDGARLQHLALTPIEIMSYLTPRALFLNSLWVSSLGIAQYINTHM